MPPMPIDPSPVPGRGQPFVDLALRRLRESLLLRVCAAAAVMGYGGLIALLLARRMHFGMAGTVALLSLGSWFFLLWWYPVRERTFGRPDASGHRAAVGNLLEAVAIGCVVCVHVLMAIIIVYSARSTP